DAALLLLTLLFLNSIITNEMIMYWKEAAMKYSWHMGLVSFAFIILLSGCATTESVTQLQNKVNILATTTEELQASLQNLETQLSQLSEIDNQLKILNNRIDEISLTKEEITQIKSILAAVQARIDKIIYETMAQIAATLNAAAQSNLQTPK
ncbi:MAG: hypothetical protein N3A02_00430, partial [Rectinema sp.]|nr:hypothetical protein [Rectinema sp.]